MTPEPTTRRVPLHARAGCPICARLLVAYRRAGRLVYPIHASGDGDRCEASAWIVEDPELVAES